MKLLAQFVDGQATVDPADKRSSPRFAFSTGLEAIDVEANMGLTGRLSDIGRNGGYVDTISPFALDATVALTITKEGQSFKTQAEVAYSRHGMGMGLMSTTTQPDQLPVLEMWLDKLGGGKKREPEVTQLNPVVDSRTVLIANCATSFENCSLCSVVKTS